jgi:phosphoribosyl 1,2-cyclic phosphodiesterase
MAPLRGEPVSLELRFWGTRGSIPSPGARTVRYGGNTPCVEIRTPEGGLVILDAGSGIRELGRALTARSDGAIHADIVLSHAHWDHIQGLPFFDPLFQSGNRFTIWSMDGLDPTVEQVVRGQMSPAVFPVPFDAVEARVEFQYLSGAPHRGPGYELRAAPVRHPGGAAGYRLSAGAPNGSGALVYIPDNELRAVPGDGSPAAWREALVEFVRGATVLVHDATYTEQEYARHHGWGHSHYRDVVELALDASVERLVLFHHHPERSDDEVDDWVARCQAWVRERGGAVEVSAAAEGMTIAI